MNLFIKKIVILGVLVLITLCVLVRIFDMGFRKTAFSHYKEWNELYGSQINADVLIQGNSRAYHHINPLVVDSVLGTNSYNLGMDGTQFDLQYARFLSYLNYNKKPQIIIQNIDEWTLGKSNLYVREQYIPYYFDSNILNAVKACDILPIDYFLYPFKYMGCNHNFLIKGFMEAFNLRCYDNDKIKGFSGNISPDSSVIVDNRKHALPEILIDKKNEKLFVDFLNYCQANDIIVVLFYAPVYSSVFDINHHQKTIAYFQKLACLHDAYILDFSNTPLLAGKLEYFYDVFHLNDKGSDIFTFEIADYIKNEIKKIR